MNNHVVKRIIICQGSIQLVTALSVLNYREKEQKSFNQEYEDYLVISGLYTPAGQIEEFANYVKNMAELAHQWKAIVYTNPTQINSIYQESATSSPRKTYDLVHQLVGTETADEIYLCRNWQLGNQLFINTYKSAEKICYGDSIGIYFSSNGKGLFAPSNPIKLNFASYIKKKIKGLISKLKEKLQLKTVFKNVEFDIGYFILPDIMGELPPMKTIVLDKLELLKTFEKLKGLVDLDYVLQLKQKIDCNPVLILLTSNFSEAQRMSEENEINAYRQFLSSQKIEPNTILLIKPHPRDGNIKIQRLQSKISDLFANTLVLSEPHLFFLPFEVLFAQVFLQSDMSVRDNIKVLTVSSACLSLKLLFHVPCVVGFGEKITPQFFYENYVDGRLEHEQYLKVAIEKNE